jgi:hypothetical protein
LARSSPNRSRFHFSHLLTALWKRAIFAG